MFVSTIVYTHAVIFAIKYVETNLKVLDPYLLTIAVNSVSVLLDMARNEDLKRTTTLAEVKPCIYTVTLLVHTLDVRY